MTEYHQLCADKIGIVSDYTHIEGGQHIYPGPASPSVKPLQRPPRVEHFIDRKKELSNLINKLQPGRVITLCGPSGIGKTALIAQAVWTLAEGDEPPELFPDGIIYHSFNNQPQADLALEAIARAFGDKPKPTPRDAALRALARRKALLLLDGAENADNLQSILDVRGNCGVLVNSQKRSDAIDDRQDIFPLEQDDAVNLLQAWGKDYVSDLDAAKQVVILVGDLPLALRLVGRYLHQTQENVSDYLPWLKETSLEALDQGQCSLESVSVLLEHSLSQVSKAAYDVLGIVGQLAQAPFIRGVVAAALDLEENELRRPINELINYGLLIRRGKWHEVSHTLIHTYAREKISFQPKNVRNLAVYYTDFARSQKGIGWENYIRLNEERPHIMMVLSKCFELGYLKESHNLAWTIERYLNIQGHLTERIIVNQTGLNITRKLHDRQKEGAWLGHLGLAYLDSGQIDKAIKQFQLALGIHREIGDLLGKAHDFGNLGTALRILGQIDKAIEHHQLALNIHREFGDRPSEATDLGNLGNAYRDLSQIERAIEHYQLALDIHRELGDRQGEADHLGNLGSVYSYLCQIDKAIEHHKSALGIYRNIGDRQGEAIQLLNLGNIYGYLGLVDKAIEHYQLALNIHRDIKYRMGEASCLGSLGGTFRILGQVDKAIEHYQLALNIYRDIKYRMGEASCLENLGIAYYDLGQIDKAVDYLQLSLDIYRNIGNRQGDASCLGSLGGTFRILGQVDKAIEHYQLALNIYRDIKYRQGEANQLGNLGNAYYVLGHVDKAVDYLQLALDNHRDIGDRQGEANDLGNLGIIYCSSGQCDKAIEHHQSALGIYRNIGDRQGEANQLGNLGNAYYVLGHVDKAIDYLQLALAIFEEIEPTVANRLRSSLSELSNASKNK